jgi:hypothetical protein
MNIRQFVSGSSVILAGWLGATFLNEVPAQRYPKLDITSPSTAKSSSLEMTAAPANAEIAFIRPTTTR